MPPPQVTGGSFEFENYSYSNNKNNSDKTLNNDNSNYNGPQTVDTGKTFCSPSDFFV